MAKLLANTVVEKRTSSHELHWLLATPAPEGSLRWRIMSAVPDRGRGWGKQANKAFVIAATTLPLEKKVSGRVMEEADRSDWLVWCAGPCMESPASRDGISLTGLSFIHDITPHPQSRRDLGVATATGGRQEATQGLSL